MKEVVAKDFAGRVDFIAQNIRTADFGDPVFPPYVIKSLNGFPIAIVGQAFPYTPIANPRYFVAEWTFGIQEESMQKVVDEARGKGAQAVVLLSHNGMDVDLKMASRVTGIDVILGGHTHDGVPRPTIVANRGGKTVVTNAGSNGKFLAVLDLHIRDGRVADFRYRLLPVFSNLLPADRAMADHITDARAPFLPKLAEELAITEGILYRRGNFNGTADQLILDALMAEKDAPIAFSPGFRWGTALLPGQAIRMEDLMDQTAITYPHVTVNEFTGETIKTILEDVADNLFNPDPYYQQGGDMVRVGGLSYAIDPDATMGKRITRMALAGKPIDAGRNYKVAGWASVSEEAQRRGRRGDLGRVRALPARAEDRQGENSQRAGDRRNARESRHDLVLRRGLRSLRVPDCAQQRKGYERGEKRQVIPDRELVPQPVMDGNEHQKQQRGKHLNRRSCSPGDPGGRKSGRDRSERAGCEPRALHAERERHRRLRRGVARPRKAPQQIHQCGRNSPCDQSGQYASNASSHGFSSGSQLMVTRANFRLPACTTTVLPAGTTRPLSPTTSPSTFNPRWAIRRSASEVDSTTPACFAS